MGMYTELIFGASLKKNTPKEVIDTLRFMCGDLEEKPTVEDPLTREVLENKNVFWACSYYFGVSSSKPFIKYDETSKNWIISTRGNIKNYGGEIETFLGWIKPYIESGTGTRDLYGVVCYEEQDEPTLYYLYDSPYGEESN